MTRIFSSAPVLAVLITLVLFSGLVLAQTCSLSVGQTGSDAVEVTVDGDYLGQSTHPFNLDFGDGESDACTITGNAGSCGVNHEYYSGNFVLEGSSTSPQVSCNAYVCRYLHVTRWGPCFPLEDSPVGIQIALDSEYVVLWSKNPISDCPENDPLLTICGNPKSCNEFTDWKTADATHTSCDISSPDNNPPYTTCVRDDDGNGLFDVQCDQDSQNILPIGTV